MLALIDYGAGNLTSVRNALTALGAEAFTATEPEALENVQGVVLPGVGHFGATAALGAGWRHAIRDAIARGTPLLGICLGMQWLFDGSHEEPGLAGLGTVRGTCSRLPTGQKVPHVGWNTLEVRRPSRLLAGVPTGSHVYFTHSYAAPLTAECVAATSYGATFASVVERGNVFGVQFHPEKSGALGLRILQNYIALASDTPSRRATKNPGSLRGQRAAEGGERRAESAR